ncbi:hypothetical protein Tco_1006234 [Tanacetum coccineum]|uniref:Uncharacterized protein n=1 Tax=Tanacetum coccineum TaxID=301880 RepID=A0ABQ5FHH7_9ASTR
MKESDAYKTFYDFATRKVIPKPKYVRPSTREKTDQTPKASLGKRLKATAKVAKSGKKKLPAQGLETLSEIALSKANQMKLITKRSKTQFHSSHASSSGANKSTGVSPGVPDVPTYGCEDEQISWKSSDEDDDDEFSTHDEEERQDEEDKDEEWSDDEAYDEVTQGGNVEKEKIDKEKKMKRTKYSSFISKMLNPIPDTGIDSILNLNTESTSLIDVPITTHDEIPHSSVTTLPPTPIPLIQSLQQTPVSITTIVPNRLREEAHAKNEDFINKIDENIKKIIKEQVKVQVKEQVSKIFPRIKKSVNEQLEAEVLIRSSNKAKTSHVVAANLSELELKKILIDKIENNKSIDRSVLWKNLYKALVDAYETDKDILATYEDAVTFKRRHDDEDDDEEPSAGSNRGSKRRKSEKEPESTSALKDKTSKSTGSSKEGFKSKTRSTSKSAQAEEQHNYKHLDWIIVRRDDDKLYTFKEDNYKRLRLQDIEDMLLLLVQGKLKNLTIEECLALSVSLRMFTRSIVIKKRVEDLQLVYSNPRGFIYQNKDKKNRLMRIDELYKFGDGTLNDVRSALDNILKRIWIKSTCHRQSGEM